MSALDTQRNRLSDDVRFELAMAAGARERRNRPAWLVMAALAIFLVLAAVALAGVVARGRSVRELEQSLQDQASVERLAAEYRALAGARAAASGEASVGEPLPYLRSTLDGLATRAGFASPPSPSDTTSTPQNGIAIRTLRYFDIREASLGTILEWLRLATQDPSTRIPGLEVDMLSLKPNESGDGWIVGLNLRRWERAG